MTGTQDSKNKVPPWRLVYIHSAGHSGSTLLESLIGSHSACFDLGEIQYLRRFLAPENADAPDAICTCGERVLSCPCWKAVDALLAPRGLRGLALAPEGSDDRALFDAVNAASAKPVLIDASKTLARFAQLKKSMDVTPVLLWADPRKIVHSHIKAAHRKDRATPSLLRLILHINRFTLSFLQIALAEMLAGRRPIVVRYENLTHAPRAALSRAMSGIGLSFEEVLLDWASATRHGLGGNRMRRTADGKIAQDNAWRTNLSLFQRVAIGLGCAPYVMVAQLLGWFSPR